MLNGEKDLDYDNEDNDNVQEDGGANGQEDVSFFLEFFKNKKLFENGGHSKLNQK